MVITLDEKESCILKNVFKFTCLVWKNKASNKLNCCCQKSFFECRQLFTSFKTHWIPPSSYLCIITVNHPIWNFKSKL